MLQHKTMPGLRAADARARQAVALLITCTVIQRCDAPVVFASVLHDASSGFCRFCFAIEPRASKSSRVSTSTVIFAADQRLCDPVCIVQMLKSSTDAHPAVDKSPV